MSLDSPTKQLGPRGGLILAVVILFVGLCMLGALSWAIWIDLAPLFWDKADCLIVSSAAETRYDSYEFVVQYTYKYDGAEYVSDKVAPWYAGSSDYETIRDLLRRYPAETQATCYVNPDAPNRAVLTLDIQWALYLLMALPLVFVPGGVFGVYRSWRELMDSRRGYHHTGEVVFRSGGTLVGLVFFGLFLFPGILYLLMCSFLPAIQAIAARSWEEVPCTILASRHTSHLGGDPPTTEYAPDILYAYQYGGKEYRSNKYDFLEAMSGDLAFIEGILADYPPGGARVCYVNPARPEEAVLNRRFDTQTLLFGLFPLPFIAFGAWGYCRIFRGLLGSRRGTAQKPSSYAAQVRDTVSNMMKTLGKRRI